MMFILNCLYDVTRHITNIYNGYILCKCNLVRRYYYLYAHVTVHIETSAKLFMELLNIETESRNI